MRDWILYKEHTFPLIRRLNKHFEIIAPVEGKGGDIVFDPITSEHDVVLDFTNTIMPPKRFFFPQFETLFSWKGKEFTLAPPRGAGFTVPLKAKRRIIFGIRPCDFSGILFLDRYYALAYEDNYYFTRRNNTLFILLGCNEPQEHCFCLSAGTGPFLKKGFDIHLTDLKDRYYVQIGSRKGRGLIEKYHYFFKVAGKEEKEEYIQTVRKAERKFKEEVDFDLVAKKMEKEEVPESLWQDLAFRCQNCGGCSYVCPTCFCFNLIDRVTGKDKGKRIRTWDSCTFSGYTRMAGGYNPREKKKDRVKRRFYHKLVYEPQQF
ncbi:4Fe-4S dicluster domain-containing protein, partial [bacterium]|nr:4Fe-4S dicluster domain-containing protein [bacterium]